MNVHLNGEPVELADGTTVAELVSVHAPSPKGVAVAIDEEVVPRSVWAERVLDEGERVELLVAARGG